MHTVLPVALSTVFALLSLLHVFWAFGGRWGGAAVIPEVTGRPVFTPSVTATGAVAVALGTACLLVLVRSGMLPLGVPHWFIQTGCTVLGAVFVLRAVGEFRLVGFFKSIKGTRFARWDSAFFSPLCLVLGTGSLLVAFSA